MPKPRAKPRKPAEPAAVQPHVPPHPPGAPDAFRARVRMYRHGLGDCFLVTFPRADGAPFQMLIDCGALDRPKETMIGMVEHIRQTVLADAGSAEGKARLDAVVGTHEHKDHLSGFNQARQLFNDGFDFGSVWLGWTENLGEPEIRKIKEARRSAADKLRKVIKDAPPAAAGMLGAVAGVMGFSSDEDDTGTGRIADALEYLKVRGKDAGDLRFLKPGTGPLPLKGVDGVRVYALGPPTDPILLKSSEVTARAKKEDLVYHLAGTAMAGVDSVCAALGGADLGTADRYHPFSPEHRITQRMADPLKPSEQKDNPAYPLIQEFVRDTYENPRADWRRIDDDWMNAFGQLALDLDSDTNNTSLVLAFEFEKTGEVLLFVGDAQVGNWQSWGGVSFEVPGRDAPTPAHDLLNRTVFYKVGHHCSHNATAKKGGLELMTHGDLVAFVPLDKSTAEKQGWEMPAPPLFKALNQKAQDRVVLSDAAVPIPKAAADAGVVATSLYVDYYLR